MAITPLSDNLDIIAALDDTPNDTSGLTPTQLKAKFDEAGNAIKDYINDTLISDIDDEMDAKVAAAEIASGNNPAGGTTGQILTKNTGDDYDYGWADMPEVNGDSAAIPSTLIERDADGRAQVADPVADADIANKEYVDANGTTTLYEHIRDISDVSSYNTVSLDISDVSFDTYREIYLDLEYAYSTSYTLYLRINNYSTAAYKLSLTYINSSILSGSGYVDLVAGMIRGAGSTVFGRMKIKFQKTPNSIVGEFVCTNPYDASVIYKGTFNVPQSNLSSFNLASATGTDTVYVRNAKLWGVRK